MISNQNKVSIHRIIKQPIQKFFDKKTQIIKRDSDHVKKCIQVLNQTMRYENLSTREMINSIKNNCDIVVQAHENIRNLDDLNINLSKKQFEGTNSKGKVDSQKLTTKTTPGVSQTSS